MKALMIMAMLDDIVLDSKYIIVPLDFDIDLSKYSRNSEFGRYHLGSRFYTDDSNKKRFEFAQKKAEQLDDVIRFYCQKLELEV